MSLRCLDPYELLPEVELVTPRSNSLLHDPPRGPHALAFGSPYLPRVPPVSLGPFTTPATARSRRHRRSKRSSTWVLGACQPCVHQRAPWHKRVPVRSALGPLPPRGRMYSPAGRRNRPRVRRKNRIRLMTRGVMKRNPKFGAFRARQAMHRVARELTCPALLLLLRLPFWAPGVDGGSVVLPERVVTMIFCR